MGALSSTAKPNDHLDHKSESFLLLEDGDFVTPTGDLEHTKEVRPPSGDLPFYIIRVEVKVTMLLSERLPTPGITEGWIMLYPQESSRCVLDGHEPALSQPMCHQVTASREPPPCRAAEQTSDWRLPPGLRGCNCRLGADPRLRGLPLVLGQAQEPPKLVMRAAQGTLGLWGTATTSQSCLIPVGTQWTLQLILMTLIRSNEVTHKWQYTRHIGTCAQLPSS
jgi:hypothetical protein